MSSTVTQTELKTLTGPAVPVAPLKLDEMKHAKFVRSSSIEKIKRFNTFISSQQYYILPAILSWLKSSQSGLQSSTEKTIFFFRSLFFRSMLYKYFIVGLKSSGVWSPERILNNLILEETINIGNFFEVFTKCFESTFLLPVAVYGACTIVLVQLLALVCFLYSTLVPYGFMFLVGCMLTIKFICYKTLFFYLCKNTKC